MIVLKNLSGDKLKRAIIANLYEVLRRNPDEFVYYFKEVFTVDRHYANLALGFFYNQIDDYDLLKKNPKVLFDVFKFVINYRKDYDSIIKKVPINFYQTNKKNFLDLLKIALNNCKSITDVEKLLDYFYRQTGDNYFKRVYELIKSKDEYGAAYNIFAFIDDVSNLDEISNNWDKYTDDYYLKNISGYNMENAKDILCKKIYNCSLEIMNNRYYQYIISNRNSELDNRIIFFEKILMAQNNEDLFQIYNVSKEFTDEQKRVLSSTFDDIGNQIDIDSKLSLSTASEYRPPEDSKVKMINNVGVYDISELDFSLIIHNISAGLGNSEITDTAIVDLSTWSSLDLVGSITISTSEISNSFLGHVTRKKNNRTEVIFAFSDIPQQEIFFSGIYDLGIDTSVQKYNELSPTDGKGQHFLARQLMTNCFEDYNEVVINRFTDKSKTQKRLPSYIVCYDEINELSIKYAEHFNIPILFIDTKKCAYRNATIIKQKFDSILDSGSLLDNVNGFFSFICGLKYNEVVHEIISLVNWEETILNAINNAIKNIKTTSDMEKMLIVINYIYNNIPYYLQGINSTTNNNDANYSDITDKFVNFQQKIAIIRQKIQYQLRNISLVNSEVVDKNGEKKR